MPHSAQPRHTNHWAPQTRKQHEQEHRPQQPTERSNPTQHAKGRTGDCPGPRKETTTRRNVTQGGGGVRGQKRVVYPKSASNFGPPYFHSSMWTRPGAVKQGKSGDSVGTTDPGKGKGRSGERPMGTTAYGGKGQGKGKASREGRTGLGGGRAQGGERPMGTAADGGKGSEGRAANGDRPIGAARRRREQHTKATCQPPPPPPRGLDAPGQRHGQQPRLRNGQPPE